jgi:transcriptional regulator of NAD metabolism
VNRAVFFPVRHAHTVIGTHTRYMDFLEDRDSQNFEEKLEQSRKELESAHPK